MEAQSTDICAAEAGHLSGIREAQRGPGQGGVKETGRLATVSQRSQEIPRGKQESPRPESLRLREGGGSLSIVL